MFKNAKYITFFRILVQFNITLQIEEILNFSIAVGY